jgi:hypothetical protein
MPTFREALADDTAHLNALIALAARLKDRGESKIAKYYIAGGCLEEEKGLTRNDWLEIASYYQSSGHALDFPQLEEGLVKLFRTMQLRGSAESGLGKRFGRAILHEVLVETLSQSFAPGDVEDIVRRLEYENLTETQARLAKAQLGKHDLMWSTYCERNTAGDPFDPRVPEHELIDDLGLSFESNDEFYLFCYEVGLTTHVPTIADAYGGGFFFPYRPGGRTLPIRYQGRLMGRPERVHRSITGASLQEPVVTIALKDQTQVNAG